MKKIRATFLFTFIALSLILILKGNSTAYELSWTAIQHRVYESENSKNVLEFEIRDNSGNWVSSANVVTGVVLKDPTGSLVNLSTLDFQPLYDYYYARFDLASSSWFYNTPLQISEFSTNILDPMVIGTYNLEVSMENGQKLTEAITFDFLLSLPIIPSRTFQIHTDSAGSLYWTWDIPEQLLTLAKTYTLQMRAGVRVYLNDDFFALYWPNIPIELGSSFAQSSIYQDVINGADEIQFALQVRTSNNNARAYSNRIIVKDLSSPVSITPRKSVAVVPLMD